MDSKNFQHIHIGNFNFRNFELDLGISILGILILGVSLLGIIPKLKFSILYSI